MNLWLALQIVILFFINESKARNHRKKYWKYALSSQGDMNPNTYDFRQPYYLQREKLLDQGASASEVVNHGAEQFKRTYDAQVHAACEDVITWTKPIVGRNQSDYIRILKENTTIMSRTCVDNTAPCHGYTPCRPLRPMYPWERRVESRCQQLYGYVLVPVVKSATRNGIQYDYDYIKYNMACSCAIL
ncbi:uncharacterized protein LOC121406353 [Lytechinus variegatus]|uniref:uncharacterized protein LOC121406353 n=1 Tax=Lytechinus variegatus TaxID=7654 RepID=UPI001BB1FB4B|nr:uncharacterized protein LOC121406353 [Lytechinus variegatus]